MGHPRAPQHSLAGEGGFQASSAPAAHPGPTEGTKSLPWAAAQVARAAQFAGLLANETVSDAK
jgi:hypothetical protein